MIWFDKRRKKFADMTKKRLNFVDKRRHNNDKVYLSNHLIYALWQNLFSVCVCDSLPTRYCRFDFRLLSIWLWKIFFLKEKHQIIINKITKKTKMLLPVLSIDLFIEPLFSFGSVSFGLLIYLFFLNIIIARWKSSVK